MKVDITFRRNLLCPLLSSSPSSTEDLARCICIQHNYSCAEACRYIVTGNLVCCDSPPGIVNYPFTLLLSQIYLLGPKKRPAFYLLIYCATSLPSFMLLAWTVSLTEPPHCHTQLWPLSLPAHNIPFSLTDLLFYPEDGSNRFLWTLHWSAIT